MTVVVMATACARGGGGGLTSAHDVTSLFRFGFGFSNTTSYWHQQRRSSSTACTSYSNTIPTASSLLVRRRRRNGSFSAKTSASRSSVVGRVASLAQHTTKDEERNLQRRIIVIDNYDSFTYNLCQYLGDLGTRFEVYRNDELTVEELKQMNPDGILISPGPGAPKDSGVSLQTVSELGPEIPLFGVCMGLQCMGEAFGGQIVRSPNGVMHGKNSLVYYDEKGEDGIFAGLTNPFIAGRYHSLVIDKESFPHNELEITAWTEDGLIMGVRHKKYKHIQGVQFHPESIITPEGKNIVQNFINLVEKKILGQHTNL